MTPEAPKFPTRRERAHARAHDARIHGAPVSSVAQASPAKRSKFGALKDQNSGHLSCVRAFFLHLAQ